METPVNNGHALVAALAAANIETQTINGTPAIVLPEGYSLERQDDLRDKPIRVKQSVVAHDVKGFEDYINAFKLDHTRLFAGLKPRPKLVGVIDYHHRDGDPEWGQHSISCAMMHSEEWTRWMGFNKKKTGQIEFAEFIEENYRDVTAPSAAELLAIALNISSMRDVEFKSDARLSSGEVQFSYVQKEVAGQMRLPERITIAPPVFVSGQRYPFEARLKHRINDGKLTLWLELDRPDLVVEHAYAQELIAIEAGTGIAVFRGLPG